MPKVSKIQTSFTTGEISQGVYGRTDVQERYDSALQVCLNYIPTLQGPIIRRPGTKYVANVKDSLNPGYLYPFQLSATQGYILEMGANYMRFFGNDGQILAGTSVFRVTGIYTAGNLQAPYLKFSALRYSVNPNPGEGIGGPIVDSSTSVISVGQVLELTTPFAYKDISKLRMSQQGNTMYITHPSYPPQKLQYFGPESWDLKTIYFQDGPYLPLNTYSTLADGARISITASTGTTPGQVFLTTGSSYPILNVTQGAQVGSGTFLINITTTKAPHFNVGDKVFIQNVFGTTEANNTISSTISTSFWTVSSLIGGSTLSLAGSVFTNAYVGSGTMFPALFMQTSVNSSAVWTDLYPDNRGGRVIGLAIAGTRYWSTITSVTDPAHAISYVTDTTMQIPTVSTAAIWEMGVFNQANGFPLANTVHQNRLFLAGAPGAAQEFDGSTLGNYESFQASGSNFQVSANNALSFTLSSQENQAINWLKSSSQGLLAGTLSGEWVISPSQLAEGLTATNVNAQQVAYFGGANVDAVRFGNAAIYVQKAQRKVRELNYFFQAGTYRSTNISELAEHLTLPSINQLVVQKEINPVIWGLRSDGQLIGLTYNRDEIQIKAGWARHILGGQSNSAGAPPSIQSLAICTASSGFYDEVWMTVNRSIAGSSVTTVEYLTKPYDYSSVQEDAYYVDCGSQYDVPLAVSNITTASACVVTTTSPHGLTASSTIRFYNVVGVGTSIIDVNGNKSLTNLLNQNTYMVASTSATAFKIQDFVGNDINTTGYSVYLGSGVVRKLVSLVTGLGWLANETVSILGDGAILAQTTVSAVGSVGLSLPAAKVSIGYTYNSDAQLLRSKDGSAQGTSIGSTRRVNRVAFMLHNVAELLVGPTFTNLLPVEEFARGDVLNADSPVPLFDGVIRENVQGAYTYSDTICFRQSQPLPGMIQSVVRFLEEFDV